MKMTLLTIAMLAFAICSLSAQNWTRDGQTVGERSGGSRYYTVDRGAVTERLAAWLRTHTRQSGGTISTESDYQMSVTVSNPAYNGEMARVSRGSVLELEVANGQSKRLYFAVAFVDEKEQWHVMEIGAGTAVLELPANGKKTVSCMLKDDVAAGTGHFFVLAYSEPFDMAIAVDRYLHEFLYERHVKAGAAICPAMVN